MTPSRGLLGAGGAPLQVVGEANVCLESRRKSTSALVSVVQGARRNLLGRDQIWELDLLAIVNAISSEAFDPLKQFPKLFTGLGKMPGVFKITLAEGTQPYRLFSPRPIPAGLREKAKKEIDSMLALGVIEPVEQSTEWCSGLTIAPKANGGIRMCVDLVRLNKGVERQVYPLPRVSDTLSHLAKGRIFSKLDANSGFWQVDLDPGSRLFTTFITPWGRFAFKRMPFGISSAPEFFQREMEKILEGVEGVVCMMDDILVFGTDETEHWVRLRTVLQKIERAGMTLRKDKCEFGKSSVRFLGHVVSGGTIGADPAKVEVILNLDPPTDKKGARRFMGMVNYLGKFSKNLASLAEPIYAVMGKKAEWLWGEPQQKAFELIKKELTQAPVLSAFDLNKRHRISADSSQYALGAVLLQNAGLEGWQPVEYASRKLTEAERRYAMIEKEALAITWACEKFDFYLVGRHFQVETDHKPLIPLLGEKDLSHLPVRIQRFKMRMMRYSYDIFHTPGSQMLIADNLSRPSSVGCDDKSLLECALVEQYVEDNIRDNISDVRMDELVQAISTDPDSLECLRLIERGWPKANQIYGSELARLYRARDQLTSYGNLIIYDSRMYVPTSLRQAYLHRCHSGHQGIDKCCRRARQYFWWPGMSKDIERYVKECEVCIETSAVKHGNIMSLKLPSCLWLEVEADIFIFKGQLYPFQ